MSKNARQNPLNKHAFIDVRLTVDETIRLYDRTADLISEAIDDVDELFSRSTGCVSPCLKEEFLRRQYVLNALVEREKRLYKALAAAGIEL